MIFHTNSTNPNIKPGDIILEKSSWNDWWNYQTKYLLSFIDSTGEAIFIGSTKIGKRGLRAKVESESEYPDLELPTNFETLPEDYFSLGQDISFYENLKNISNDLSLEILAGLNDIALNPELLDKFSYESVLKNSLLREIPKNLVTGQFHRYVTGGAITTNFDLKLPLNNSNQDYLIDFSVAPDSKIPTNIHTIIGRNGVGKSTALRRFRDIISQGKIGNNIANIVSVSFSVFDDVMPVENSEHSIPNEFIGLTKISEDECDPTPKIKDRHELNDDFTNSLRVCMAGPRKRRLINAVDQLQTDEFFNKIQILRNIREFSKRYEENPDNIEGDLVKAGQEFAKMSSGHQIVLYTITKLVELVNEKTIVLFDEPELHLHPPLLSAFINTFNNLLIEQNGLAIIATHSPVVLQEIPRNCVWIIERNKNQFFAMRPSLETYGENVGILTKEVFNLELSLTGFYRKMKEAAHSSESLEEALEKINHPLGLEAIATLQQELYTSQQSILNQQGK